MTRPPPSPPLRKNFPRQLDNLTASDVSTAPSRPRGAPDALPDSAARAALTASSGSGLALPGPVLPVRTVHLHDTHPGRGQVAGQARAVTTGPFDTGHGE